MERRRGQYDLEDEYLWFLESIVRDRRWRSGRPGEPVTLSDDSRLSLIQLDCPHIELMNEKQNFVEICKREEWMPHSVVLRLGDRNLADKIDEMRGYPLLFLKKAGPGIGGGFDVTPIVGSSVLDAIEKQNANPKYRRDVFILQAGVVNPLLTGLGQKIDLRLYMLMVGDGEAGVAFYACRVGDVRNTAAFPYDPTSEDAKLQVTNVAQNRQGVADLSTITRVFSFEDHRELWEKFMQIVKRLGVLYGPLIGKKRSWPFVTLIGLDAVVDRDTMDPMIVELNRRPTVYTPDEARSMRYSSALFMPEVFDLGVEAIVHDSVGRVQESRHFVLAHRH